MPRSVVLRKSYRCPRCELPPRWCVCDGLRTVECPIRVDVLMHYMETYRPSSTGRLIHRVVAGARQHVYRRERPLDQADIVQPGKTLWILHPSGEPLPAAVAPADLQIVLLDGTWPQASEMLHRAERWGRRVCVPMTGESRYWLRAQHGDGRFSTIEALMALLSALGLQAVSDRLRVQFELHVYAGLRARGSKAKAEEFLATSLVRDALPDVLARLNTRRPLLPPPHLPPRPPPASPG